MTKYNRIPSELRPAVIERVRQLNADGRSDPEIARALGINVNTIRNLRQKANIPANPKGAGPQSERICPVCKSPIEVTRDVIDEHRALFGRIGRGALNGTLVQIAEDCPASANSYSLLLNKELTCAP